MAVELALGQRMNYEGREKGSTNQRAEAGQAHFVFFCWVDLRHRLRLRCS
jgi:hypothetical protein